MKVLFVMNDSRFAYNLRQEVMAAAVNKGHEVYLLAEHIGYEQELENLGIRLVDIKVDRRGTNPFSDVSLLKGYFKKIKEIQPDIVLTNNVKPNIYVGIVCRILKLAYITNITGLGTAVENSGFLQKVTILLYRIGIKGAKAILFQNADNQSFFERKKMIPKGAQVIRVPGSGVNLERFHAMEYPKDGKTVFLYAARIMKEKGIDEFLDVAIHFAKVRNDVSFEICGMCDDKRYLEKLKKLEMEGVIKYHGLQKDLLPFYKQCSLFLYPSYYPEGMSNVLLEAAACARPIIAADRSGCRETVEDTVTGYVVPVKDSHTTIETVQRFLDLTSDERKEMGLAGRKKMEKEFDRRYVVDTIMDLLTT